MTQYDRYEGMTDSELSLGRKAASVIAHAGGELSLAEYDLAMGAVLYFAPMGISGEFFPWMDGWGLSRYVPRGDQAGKRLPGLGKQNHDKLCVFAAVKMGLVESFPDGYRLSAMML